jgi:hypothetical protein
MKAKGIFSVTAVLLLGFIPLAGQDEGITLRQQMRENLGTLRILRLTQALNLTEDQAARIYPMINRIEKEKIGIQKELAKDLQNLRRLLRTAIPGESTPDADRDDQCHRAVLKITEYRRAIRTKEDELEAFLEKSLSPLQQARYVIFQIEFNQGLGEALNRARLGRQGQGMLKPPIKK